MKDVGMNTFWTSVAYKVNNRKLTTKKLVSVHRLGARDVAFRMHLSRNVRIKL